MSNKNKWSTNTPTQAGIYWVKFNSGDDAGEVWLVAFELIIESSGHAYMRSNCYWKREVIGGNHCGWGFEATGKPIKEYEEVESDTEFWGPLEVPK